MTTAAVEEVCLRARLSLQIWSPFDLLLPLGQCRQLDDLLEHLWRLLCGAVVLYDC